MLSVPILWLLAGLILCLMELFLPTAFIELTMGISAIVVAVVAQWVPSLLIQVALWVLLSAGLTIWLRQVFPKRKHSSSVDSKQARTLTEIGAGDTGRVIYEGNSWQACCADEQLAIAPNQKVYVVGRRGTTLIVLPESLVV